MSQRRVSNVLKTRKKFHYSQVPKGDIWSIFSDEATCSNVNVITQNRSVTAPFLRANENGVSSET